MAVSRCSHVVKNLLPIIPHPTLLWLILLRQVSPCTDKNGPQQLHVKIVPVCSVRLTERKEQSFQLFQKNSWTLMLKLALIMWPSLSLSQGSGMSCSRQPDLHQEPTPEWERSQSPAEMWVPLPKEWYLEIEKTPIHTHQLWVFFSFRPLSTHTLPVSQLLAEGACFDQQPLPPVAETPRVRH